MVERGSRPDGYDGGALLRRVAGLVTRHPRLLAAAWLVLMLGLGVLGSDLEHNVSTRPVFVEGSDAQRQHEIVTREFGGEDALVVMLRGPQGQVERQGRELARRIEAMPRALTISPWNASGTIEGLRPEPGVAGILVSVGRPPGEASSDLVALVREQARKTVSAPVRVTIGGGPAIVESVRSAIERAAKTGERIALPVLLIVLLLVCRSVLAAAMPVVIGGLVVGATRGVLDLLAEVFAIDPIALGAAGMLGLALGVDYSLLIVSRFREEMEKEGDVRVAVGRTVVTTGRSIVPAGSGLVLAMLVSLELVPGTFVTSIAIAVIAAAVLSVLSAIFFAPALLMLLGTRLDRWSLPRRRPGGSVVLVWSRRLSSRPGVVLGLIFALMLFGAWAFTLNTKTGSIAQLPPDDPGRLQQEAIVRELGPGWIAPVEIAMDGGDRPVTTQARLNALTGFQRRVERDPGVEAMAGFAGLEGVTDQLGGAERSFASQERGLGRLDRGLAGAQSGAVATADGLVGAADGARQLGSAVGQAQDGSGSLASGLRTTADGSEQLSGGLGEASEGSGELASATSKASDGAGRLAAQVKKAQERSGEAVGNTRVLKNALRAGEGDLAAVDVPLGATQEQLAAAWQALQRMTAGRGDPQYAAAVEAVRAAGRGLTGADPGSEEGEDPGAESVAAGVEQAQGQFSLGLYLAERQRKSDERARDGVESLAKASSRLDRGLRRLLRNSRRMSRGIARLSAGGEEIPAGLRQLTEGAERLVGGLGEVEEGSGGLASGLDGGAHRSQLLTGALGRMHASVEEQSQGSQLGVLQEQSPGLFDSGYFYLAGLDGGPPRERAQAGFLVSLENGGSAARMMVIPRDEPSTSAAAETRDRLTAEADELARQTGAEVVIGGLPPDLADLDTALRDQAPLARIVLCLVTFLVLLPVVRSLTLPLIAAVLNLLTVSATFGLLALLFNGSLLGGPGYVDSSLLAAVVILIFGLGIDYEVFIFARMREEYVRTGSHRAALDRGLGQTAHVITGAAVIMIAVFLAFAVSSAAVIRNLGVAMAIAVFIDAFVIRFVIVPSLMRALGPRSWWIPRWLDRLLPGGSAPGGEAERGAAA